MFYNGSSIFVVEKIRASNGVSAVLVYVFLCDQREKDLQ